MVEVLFGLFVVGGLVGGHEDTFSDRSRVRQSERYLAPVVAVLFAFRIPFLQQ